MREADCIVDIGPWQEKMVAKVVASWKCRRTDGECQIHYRSLFERKNQDSCSRQVKRKPQGYLKVKGAQENNLKNINVKFPIGVITCVTGVSGSGKSSLVNEILYKKLACVLNRARIKPGKHKDIEGTEQLDKIINIDQSPIGRTPTF